MLLSLALCLGWAGCQEKESEALSELEGLSFVPAANHSLFERAFLHPADWRLEQPILIDRFEVTRGAFLKHLAKSGDAPRIPAGEWVAHEYDWEHEDLALPAEMTYAEATDMARARGMRLPTAREWLHVAMGRTGQRYPWEGNDQDSVCNTVEADIGGPTLVGTFASGRSPMFDCYDLLGNVWEWTSSYVPGRMDSVLVQRMMREIEEFGHTAQLVSVMGGSYSSRRLELYTWGDDKYQVRFNARTVDKESLTPEIGARMAADAEEYLFDQAAHWGQSFEAKQRVQWVGKRWAGDRFAREQLEAMLERLQGRPNAPLALGWLAAGVRGTFPGG